MFDSDDDRLFKGFNNYAALTIAAVFILLGLTWAVQGNDFFLTKYFAPKYEASRREAFEESKAYNEGMAQELRHAQLEYAKAKPDQKDAMASVILHSLAGYDTTKLPSDLQQFVRELEARQGL